MTTPFDTLDDYIGLPRINDIALSPDGARAVLSVATLSKDKTTYERALWEVAADGSGEPRRLTRSAKGEGAAAFLPDGDLLFVSARPDAGEDEKAQLWLLPAGGGEARCVTRLAGGVGEIVAVAADAPVVLLSAPLLPGAGSLEEDATLRAARGKKKVAAMLHTGYPIRHWDHDLGPDGAHYLALDLGSLAVEPAVVDVPETKDGEPAPYPAWLPRPVDLTSDLPTVGIMASGALSPDGVTAYLSLEVAEGVQTRYEMHAVDTESAERSAILGGPGEDVSGAAVSPDGTRLAYVRSDKATPAGPADTEVWVAAVDGSRARRVAPDWDRWAGSVSWAPDGASLIVTADDNGRGPVFRIDLGSDEVTALTSDDAAYVPARVDRASGDVVALRASIAEPAQPVRVTASGDVVRLATPAPSPATTASVVDVETTASDGARVRGWLLTPEGASAGAPAPLLLWIHGGPLGSWNAWSWRWNPHLAVARGYAVLLPDPALSTGYGHDFIARGWNSWGDKPYTDLLALTDAVEARLEIDASRTAAMGGSFGGYMANWVAGHTDRFRAIVTHASLWALDQFGPTTDHSGYWQSIFTPEAMEQHSPHHSVADIVTPMLVIHGDKDYRVPIGEGLRLWSDLNRVHGGGSGEFAHRFLYFPDENHWILKPQHAAVWYEAVFAFLSEHVLGEQASYPEVLGR